MELIAPTTARRLARFITDTVRAADVKGVVIGLSGQMFQIVEVSW